MFSGLRQGSRFYILSKGEDVGLKVGIVTSFTAPHPKQAHQGMAMFGAEMVVDITAKVGDEEVEFKNLNANMNIANSGELVVSDSQEAMSVEVESLLRNSRQVLDSIPHHEQVVSACDTMLRELNPQFAKEKQQEEKIGALEERMGNIDEKLTMMFDLLSDTLGRKKTKE